MFASLIITFFPPCTSTIVLLKLTPYKFADFTSTANALAYNSVNSGLVAMQTLEKASKPSVSKAIVIGGGIGGLTLARACLDVGIEVEVYE